MTPHLELQGRTSGQFWILGSKKKKKKEMNSYGTGARAVSSTLGIIIKEAYLFSIVKLRLPKNTLEGSRRCKQQIYSS